MTLLLSLLHSGSLDEVSSLPGAPPLPTGHFAGFLNYSISSPAAQLETFYYHVQHANKSAPLCVWMNGGPGASSLMGLFTELGPQLLNNRAGPDFQLQDNPHAWSHLASLLVWEQPAGVGFSRCAGGAPCGFVWDDAKGASANLAFLLTFYAAFPEAATRDLVIVGESYAGVCGRQDRTRRCSQESDTSQLATGTCRCSRRPSSSTTLRGMGANCRCAGWLLAMAASGVLCYAVLCYAMLCYAMPCYAMLCYAMLCYAAVGPNSLCSVCAASMHPAGCRYRYAVEGGCGADSLDLFVTTLERAAPGIA